jgi:hypothetical protein
VAEEGAAKASRDLEKSLDRIGHLESAAKKEDKSLMRFDEIALMDTSLCCTRGHGEDVDEG